MERLLLATMEIVAIMAMVGKSKLPMQSLGQEPLTTIASLCQKKAITSKVLEFDKDVTNELQTEAIPHHNRLEFDTRIKACASLSCVCFEIVIN
jgi:hypothetical protein